MKQWKDFLSFLPGNARWCVSWDRKPSNARLLPAKLGRGKEKEGIKVPPPTLFFQAHKPPLYPPKKCVHEMLSQHSINSSSLDFPPYTGFFLKKPACSFISRKLSMFPQLTIFFLNILFFLIKQFFACCSNPAPMCVSPLLFSLSPSTLSSAK